MFLRGALVGVGPIVFLSLLSWGGQGAEELGWAIVGILWIGPFHAFWGGMLGLLAGLVARALTMWPTALTVFAAAVALTWWADWMSSTYLLGWWLYAALGSVWLSHKARQNFAQSLSH